MADLCEVCGRRDAAFLAYIEGAKLSTCPSCARSGRILHSLEETEQGTVVKTYEKRPPVAFREEETIIENYGKTIRAARNQKGMKREEVAKATNEKESFLELIEKERTTPPFKVLRKLEKFFGIKLIEKTTPSLVDESVNLKTPQKKIYTLADALEFQKSKKKKREE